MATPDVYQQIANAAAGFSADKMQTNPYALIGQGVASFKPTFSNPWSNLAANLIQNLAGGALAEGARQSNISYQNEAYKNIGTALLGGQLENPDLNPYLQEIKLADARHKQSLIEGLLLKDAEYKTSPDYQAQLAYGGESKTPYGSLIESLAGVQAPQPLQVPQVEEPRIDSLATELTKKALTPTVDIPTPDKVLLSPSIQVPSQGITITKPSTQIDTSIANPKIDVTTLPDPVATKAPQALIQAETEAISGIDPKEILKQNPLSPVDALRQAKGNKFIAQNLLQEDEQKRKFALDLDSRQRDVETKSFSKEQDLRKEYLNHDVTKSFDMVRSGMQRAFIAAKANNRTADLDLVYAVAKIVDPESVVREGEIKTFLNSQRIPDYIKNAFTSQAFGTSGFDEDARNGLVDIAKNSYNSRRARILEKNTEYENLSNTYGFNPKNITIIKPETVEDFEKNLFSSSNKTSLTEEKKNQIIDGISEPESDKNIVAASQATGRSFPREIGKSLLAGASGLLGTANLLNPFNPASFQEKFAQNQTVEDLRKEYVGDAKYNTAAGRIVGKVAEALPSMAIPIPGTTLAKSAIGTVASGLGGGLAKEAGLPEWLGNLLGGSAPGLSKGIAKKVGQYSDDLVRSAVGVRRSDYTKSLRKSGLIDDIGEETRTSLKKAVKEVNKLGTFKGLDKSPVALLDKNTTKLNEVTEELTSILTKADTAIKDPIIPKYNIAEKFINSSKTERSNLQKAYKEITDELNETLDGSLSSIQAAKVQLYGKTYGENSPAKETINKYIAADLKKIIEDNVDDLAKKELIPKSFVGKVKELNKNSGNLQQVRPILQREVVNLESTAPGDMAVNLLGLKQGAFRPILIGAGLGSPGGVPGFIAGSLGGALTSRPGRFATAAALEGASKIMTPIANVAPGFKESIARALIQPGVALSRGAGVETPAINIAPTLPIPEEVPVMQNPDLFYTGIPEVQTEEPKAMINPVSIPTNQGGQVKIESNNPDLSRLFKAVIKQESGGNPNAVSNVGALGLMQIMPATGKQIAKELGIKDYDLKDPDTNRMFGEYYLTNLLKMFDGDVKLALTAYHSGPGRVQKLLQRTKGSSLEDIIHLLGPVGQKYANSVVKKMAKV